jgi:hypothetical protein
MTRIEQLREGWWSFLGDVEAPALPATYAKRPPRPALDRALDERLEWFTAQPPVRGSLLERQVGDATPTRELVEENVAALLGSARDGLPPAFQIFARDVSLRQRLRSATACYLDLGERTVSVEAGGMLIHFLSDQQWVLHWLLYIGPGPSGCVVATPEPLGFSDDGIEHFSLGSPSDDAFRCASSFNEFLYRFWIENEIWFALNDKRVLTREQQHYLDTMLAAQR